MNNKRCFINQNTTSNLEQVLCAIQPEPSFKKTFFDSVKSGLKKGLEAYFEPKSFEKWGNGKVYELLGIRYFKKVLPTGGDWVARKTGWRPIIGQANREKGLNFYEFFTRVYETIHTIAFPLYIDKMIEDIQENNFESAAITLALNIAINVYPIMTQRYNRTRIYKSLEDISNKKENKTATAQIVN